jgi:FkbM family methyltransferase
MMRTISRAKSLIKAFLRLFDVEITRSKASNSLQPSSEAKTLRIDIDARFSWPLRPIAFVLVSSNHGTMIVNRNDFRMTDEKSGYGVGLQILSSSSYNGAEVASLLSVLSNRRRVYGDGVVALDCGANCGIHSVEWSRHMFGWGKVIAIEAQEKIYYALCGNLALNNCLNAKAILAAVGNENREILIPNLDYLKPASFGSLELRRKASNEYIGQDIDYLLNCDKRQQITIDHLNLDRVDLIKIDVEGMELEVLAGAERTLRKHRPQMFIEWIKSDCDAITQFLERLSYRYIVVAENIFAVHDSDKSGANITMNDNTLTIRTIPMEE